MNTLQLVLLAWAVAATTVCVFMYGAFRKDGGRKARSKVAQRDAWADRITAGQ